MTFQVPRMPTSGPPDAKFAQDVIEFMRLCPIMEIRDVGVDGNFPVSVLTHFDAVGAVVLQMYETNDPAQTISPTGLACRRSDNPQEPGIVIDAMDGVTLHTEYTARLLILGVRT